MSNDIYPRPPGHKTFQFQSVTISSDFDSGNCSNVQKIGNNQYNLWIATDHPKNNYRTWFHFYVKGVNKGAILSFTIKNMQNQSRLLNEGLVPVYREQGTEEWKRISQKVNTGAIQFNQGWIQWTFKHCFKSSQKHYFAFFYPWSNEENSNLLSKIQLKVRQNPDIYFYRANILKSLQGRPVQFLVITSNKNKSNKEEQINDENLFKNIKKPFAFSIDKPGIVLSARVHPGQVPGSHVMTGVIKTLVQNEGVGKLLRDQFVFYIFPILNPDGVARGHYRVDTNGINLNRCYLNPSAKQQPSIYAIRKIILHLHEQERFFAYLDFHAHASRKGTFIYGNCSNQLMKQVKACLFPKLLSMNSMDFEYEGSNFTQKNMYGKDRGDHISKEGSGRVAMYKVTKNPYCWTMQCNYNISRINNILQAKKYSSSENIQINENCLDPKIIVDYKQPSQVEAKQFFTIGTYHKLGYEICSTFLDLIQKNPTSRIDNPQNHFKNIKNVKMNLAVALLRMAPNRFEPTYKKIYSGLQNSQNPQIIKNSLKALYFTVIRDGRFMNINNYVKTGDISELILPSPRKEEKRSGKTSNFRTRETRYNSLRSNQQVVNIENKNSITENRREGQNENEEKKQQQQFKYIILNKQNQWELQLEKPNEVKEQKSEQKFTKGTQNSDEVPNVITSKVVHINKQQEYKRIAIKIQNFRMIGIMNKKRSSNQNPRETTKSYNKQSSLTPSINDALIYSKLRTQEINYNSDEVQEEKRRPKLIKGTSFKEKNFKNGH